jgi:uncharacterized protein
MHTRTHRIDPVGFSRVHIDDVFWTERQKSHRRYTLPTTIKRAEETGRIDNFRKAAGWIDGGHEGRYYNDSDVYKILEGIAYTLTIEKDAELEKKADTIIEAIEAAQHDDGYINTYVTLTESEARWTDMTLHETYCGGHLMEAGIAYFQATGKRRLLDVAERFARHMLERFGPDGEHWVTGHQEVELALVRLYRLTGNRDYLKLARWFLDERGKGHGRGTSWDRDDFGPAYAQDDVPVVDIEHPRGHAVRAMYMYAGMADVASEDVAPEYLSALERVWESVTQRNMYLSGGVGSSKNNEGFTVDYDLPNADAYAETCASVGMVFWNYRMFLLTGESKYIDVAERVMYNGVLAGVSLEGGTFFYDNPLESDGTHHREPWYECSCCPTQIARFIPSIGNYVYAVSDRFIYINLFVANDASFSVPAGEGSFDVGLRLTTAFPWDGNVTVRVETVERVVDDEEWSIAVRLPNWANERSIEVNGTEADFQASVVRGYTVMTRSWRDGDEITISLGIETKIVRAHENVTADRGKAAVVRGPLVYCAEEIDNRAIESIVLQPDTKFFRVSAPTELAGMTSLKTVETSGDRRAMLIPYFAWDNRKPGRMTVWFPVTHSKRTLYYGETIPF